MENLILTPDRFLEDDLMACSDYIDDGAAYFIFSMDPTVDRIFQFDGAFREENKDKAVAQRLMWERCGRNTAFLTSVDILFLVNQLQID